MEHSCKGRAASFTADYYISAQWVTGSTCTGNLEGNRHRAFCSSTCPAVSPAFVQSDKLFLSPVWTFHALLGYLEIFLSRNQLRFSLFGMFNEADISGKPQSVCMHWHSKPTVSWTHHVLSLVQAVPAAPGLRVWPSPKHIQDCFDLLTDNGQSWSFRVVSSLTGTITQMDYETSGYPLLN